MTDYVRMPSGLIVPQDVAVTWRARSICRGCGCTDDNACPDGCFWVEPDLCSQCVDIYDEDDAPWILPR